MANKTHVSESLRVLYKFERFKTEQKDVEEDDGKKLKPDNISLKSLQIWRQAIYQLRNRRGQSEMLFVLQTGLN